MRIGYRKRTTAGDKTICLPLPAGIDYDTWILDAAGYRIYLDEQIAQHPERFPVGISDGYWLDGFVTSKRQQMKTRRILLKHSRDTYQIHPDTVMPYMIGRTEDVEKGLYLRRYGVPYEAIAHVLGMNAMYWYNATQALGRISIVGSMVKDPNRLPLDLAADEKHSWWLGQRIYIAVTVAMGCFLGVGLSATADTAGLSAAYGEFKAEAIAQQPDYQPATVNTAGWDATQQAWQRLFPQVTLILCFLHAVLGVQQRCRRHPDLFTTITDQLWRFYHSPSLKHFAQRLRRLREWTASTTLPDVMAQKLQRLFDHAPNFQQHFDFPNAHRTSNMADRLINFQDRILYNMQYFHGSMASARQALRAMAMLWNFHPYGRKTQAKPPFSQSPFEDLNGFRYHDHWLKNLLIAASMNGRNCGRPVLLKSMEN